MVRKELRCPLCNSLDVLVKRSDKKTEKGIMVTVARCQVCQSTFLHERDLQGNDSATC